MIRKNLSLQYNEISKVLQEKMLNVLRNSIQDFIEEANKPLGEGGKMHVDTGFLRSSGVGAINEIPKGEIEGRKRELGEKGVLYQSNPSGQVLPLLTRLKPDDVFYYGWTARYAGIRELYDGFQESACDKWETFVKKNLRRLEK